ncbi:ATP-dependent DNA helicase RecG [Rhodovarius lipocyclicus]|uniref:ATP-dependent DNA helicase RecG n=1 Tax=Rhodovarius lipocyclicus TaxID=268410 RepID=UPI001F28C007|nr:ATP-dependent DNA helicase RecG [Rhodovarius lipocyclicus]
MEHPVSSSGAGKIREALHAPLTSLRGIGPRGAALLKEATGGDRIWDLLLHLPERFASRQRVESPADAPPDRDAVLPFTAESHRAARSRQGARYVEVRGESGGARLVLRFMNGHLPWVEQRLPRGEPRWISGRIRPEGADYSAISPDVAADPGGLPEREPVWPLTAGLNRAQMARCVAAVLEAVPPMPEWHDPALLKREAWPPMPDALRLAHAEPAPEARARLAYDEQLADQLALALVRRRARAEAGRSITGDGALRARALAAFGHPLTGAQREALAEIDADLAAPHRMRRLLQGDVGAGKTLVALLAMLRAVESGAQAALMVPTELLARQHLRTLWRLCGAAGVEVALLAGSVTGAERRRVLRGLADGSIPIVVGTHALFQEAVEFRDLALAVVDEQHRFGVEQRLTLAGKGALADLLVMTATPIPRTLLLTHWGEMSVSRIREKPAGRQPITTTLHGLSQLEEVIAACGRAMDKGARIYWVCPHVAESETMEVAAAETRYAELKELFGDTVALAHGRMDVKIREEALARFARGEARLLVATTVIEVGVDVPEATVMVIEHAERFGLAQLHQLRGRVGRGRARSFCMLLYDEAAGRTARDRLGILRETEDGFLIADEDFRLRGAGEALGTRQSGHAMARLALEDGRAQDRLVAMAHQDAALLLERDPALAGERGVAARLLLGLFGKDAAMATLGAG